MHSENQPIPSPTAIRLNQLSNYLHQQKKSIMTGYQASLNNFRHQYHFQNDEQINKNLSESYRFVNSIVETFFQMLSHEDWLLLTTEIEVSDKVNKFKKNLEISNKKLFYVLAQSHQMKIKPHEFNQAESNLEEMMGEAIQHKDKRKSKNCKIPIEGSISMVKWLLANFENPYPSKEVKQQMAKQGNIPDDKVNNWFINARERIVKSYFGPK